MVVLYRQTGNILRLTDVSKPQQYGSLSRPLAASDPLQREVYMTGVGTTLGSQEEVLAVVNLSGFPARRPDTPATLWNEAATSPLSPSRGPSQVPRQWLPSITGLSGHSSHGHLTYCLHPSFL